MEAVITLHEDRCYGESKWKTRKGEKGKYMTIIQHQEKEIYVPSSEVDLKHPQKRGKTEKEIHRIPRRVTLQIGL